MMANARAPMAANAGKTHARWLLGFSHNDEQVCLHHSRNRVMLVARVTNFQQSFTGGTSASLADSTQHEAYAKVKCGLVLGRAPLNCAGDGWGRRKFLLSIKV
jgi:hypothetical protein